jgi:hypothetical protein
MEHSESSHFEREDNRRVFYEQKFNAYLSELRKQTGLNPSITIEGNLVLLHTPTAEDITTQIPRQSFPFEELKGRTNIGGAAKFDYYPDDIYYQKKDELDVRTIAVAASLRGKGISKILLARILMEHPDTLTIQSVLAGDNSAIWWREMKTGKKPEDAFRSTPAYKICKDLGFSNVEVGGDYGMMGKPQFFTTKPAEQ